jgi:hypothetical protein
MNICSAVTGARVDAANTANLTAFHLERAQNGRLNEATSDSCFEARPGGTDVLVELSQ